ncbi:hypothetical protein ABZ896_12625 [Streptomyces sp. NPDC047072]|uniref:hypothetical protein n=1 Tax=Streptomyces sp. NPDC047072 TaxID=3154809 RepID=UPI0033FB747A
MSVILPADPGLRLLVSLAAWTWPGTGADGRDVGHILITHSPALTGLSTAETVEARMRRLSDSLGSLASAREVVPDLGRCLQIVGDHVLLHISGASRQLRLPTRRSWTELAARHGEAVLLLGLDPLPQSADAARIDSYLDTALAADRLRFGRARTR